MRAIKSKIFEAFKILFDKGASMCRGYEINSVVAKSARDLLLEQEDQYEVYINYLADKGVDLHTAYC